MNTSDLLTSEERELARLLGRPGDKAVGPSARVDADILAMARNPQASVATPAPAAALPPRPQATGWGRRHRMVSSLAAVASLVLVVGLAWQLRPLPPQPESLPSSAEVAMAPVSAPSPEAANASMNTADSAAAMPAAAPMVADVEHAPMAAPAAPAAHRPAAHANKPAAIAEAPAPVAFKNVEAPAPIVVAPAAPAPPPMAEPAAAQLDEVVTTTQSSAADAMPAPAAARTRSVPPRPAFNGPAIVPHAGAKATAKAADARLERAQPADISADIGLSRHQWIKRIRERNARGDVEGARASLQRFIHDYPEARVPTDLRPLLEP